MKIQRLNMDNSWLLEMQGLRILVDPWLEGVEIDYFGWFNTQWHRSKPMAYEDLPAYDVVLITQKYPDHFHPQTLLKLQPKKVLAPKSIEAKLKALLPQSEIIAMHTAHSLFEENNVRIQWYPTNRKIDPIYDAFLIEDKQEALFLATHGYFINQQEIQNTSPIKLLISPFNYFKLPFYLGGTVSPGIEGLKHLNEKLHPQFIVATHDEDKHAKGLVIKMATVKRIFSEDLRQDPALSDKVLELNHYNPIQL